MRISAKIKEIYIMRKRLLESENDIILNSIYELTHLYDEDGNEVPSYFNIKEIIDNYGLSQKDVIDIAKNHNYNVFRIPGGDNLVNTIVIAHEDLSYGDVVKENTTKVDIKELGDDTNDSFNMEEDMEEVKPWGQRKIYDQLKQDTNNFTIEKDEYIYAFEEECRLAYKILEKKYEDVDYWFIDNVFSPTGESWHLSFSNPIKGKKKVVKEDVNHPLVGKKVNHLGVDCTIEDVEVEDDDTIFTLSNGKSISVKICVERGNLTSDDEEVNKFLDSFKVKEEPKEVKKEEPKEKKSEDEIYREKAREDFYASTKISPMYKHLEHQLKKGLSLISYEMAYYQEYLKLLKSPIERARRRTNNSDITIAKTYRGDVDELVAWLKRAITKIDVFTNEDNKEEIDNIVKELNKQHGTNYEAKINTSKDGDQFVVTITSDENILKDMPEEFKTWTAPKNLGLHRANAEKVDALVYNDKNRRLTSNGIIKDLLYNYDFKLGDYKEKNESIDREIDDGPEHGYATVADYERGQEILDEMAALREKERVEGEKLLRAWAVDKTMSDEEFHAKSEELSKSTQEAVEKLYQELIALPVKKNESIARMIYDANKDKKANNKKVKIIYGSSPKEAKANEPIRVTLKQLQDYKDNYSYVEVIEESLEDELEKLTDRIASYLDERDIDAWVEETNRECVDVGTDNEEDFNKIKSVLDEKGITYEDISGGAPKYWGVRVWPNLKESIDDIKVSSYKYLLDVYDTEDNFIERKFFRSRPEADRYVDALVDLFDIKILNNEVVELDNGKDFFGTYWKVIRDIKKDESLNEDAKHGDVENAPFVVSCDGEKFAFDTKHNMDAFIERNKYSFDKIEVVRSLEEKIEQQPDVEYKGITIEHFPLEWHYANKTWDQDGYVIKSPYYLQSNSEKEKNYLPLYCEDEYGEVLNFKTLDDAKRYIDEWIITKKGTIKVKHRDEVHFEILPEYRKEKEDELEEDIEKHDTLNPKLFDDEELKPEIKDAIQNIADEFIKELNEDEVNFTLKDIVLLGSNVSYNYTKDSDLDIHLIADSSALDCPESLIDKLYGAYRSIFNKNYDITIKGIPAEIYVELDEPKAMSNGIYSLNNGWIKKPEVKVIPDLDEEAFDNLFTIWEDDYFDLLERDSTSDEVAQFIENIYELRKESIAEEGEYGLGNLVFKEFRNLGYLDKLKDLRKELKGKELSLEHLDEEMSNSMIEKIYETLDDGATFELPNLNKFEGRGVYILPVESYNWDDGKPIVDDFSKEFNRLFEKYKDNNSEKFVIGTYHNTDGTNRYSVDVSIVLDASDLNTAISKIDDSQQEIGYLDENGKYMSIKNPKYKV